MNPTQYLTVCSVCPIFFLAGFPKSGTTSLHATLNKHPQVLAPNVKEPHRWTRIPLADMNPDYLKLVAMRYPLYFISAASKLDKNFKQGITYDGTQSLLWDSNFLSEINNIDYCTGHHIKNSTQCKNSLC